MHSQANFSSHHSPRMYVLPTPTVLVSFETDHTPKTTDRTKRVKEARDEAKKEIEAYRAKKEEEFKKYQAEVGLRPPRPSPSSQGTL